jgi:hypothetical protein
MKMTAIRSVALGVSATLLCSTFAFAHHSFAMFDRKVEVVLTGAVKEFQWVNPHSYIQLVSDKDGQNWTIEGGGVNGLAREGWKRDSLKPGDKISVHVHPLRSGAPGAELLWVQRADGTILGNKAAEGGPNAPKP